MCSWLLLIASQLMAECGANIMVAFAGVGLPNERAKSLIKRTERDNGNKEKEKK